MSFVGDKKLLSWEEGIHKITGAPAMKIGLKSRGVIKKDNYADIVLIDPERIDDATTDKEPHKYSEGVVSVVVNGSIAFVEGQESIGCFGGVLKKSDK